ncbi:MAG: DUF4445 domain-containing protein [Firmicutes bacterium]|nr:DUF4445 domain-containing protein [Bacillota bacterium]
MSSYTITIQQPNRQPQTLTAPAGQNLFSVLREHGRLVPSPCGGKGLCGKCKVKISHGPQTLNATLESESSFLSVEEVKAGYRLACRVSISEDLTIELPAAETGTAQIMSEGGHNVPLNPLLTRRVLQLPTPVVKDQTADVERVEQALGLPGSIKPELFSALPTTLRDGGFRLSAVLAGEEVLALEAGTKSAADGLYGIAVDLGTTTIVGYLLDLTTGRQLDTYAALNPQQRHGADVISRIDYTLEHEQGLSELAQLVRAEFNKMIAYFSRKDPALASNIYQLVVVGNTIMMHLLAGLEVKNIAVSPFIPVVTRDFTYQAAELGLEINPRGKIMFLPMISGYVGADTVAAILASNLAEQAEISLLLAIGPNGEIALGNRERILTCSAAAGPAFEGAKIRYGMGGLPGAINRVQIEEDLTYTTIGEKPARGICGSAVVSLTAQLVKAGLMESSGRLKTADELGDEYPAPLKARLCKVDGQPALRVASQADGAVEDIYFTQQDIRETQLAKAAIGAGIRILLQEMAISITEVKTLYLAGGFGNYIDPQEAVEIGLLPREMADKVIPIGNGAGAGAKMALLSQDYHEKARQIRAKTTYLELSTNSAFQDLFVDSLEFR